MKSKSKKKIIIILILLFAVGGFFFFANNGENEQNYIEVKRGEIRQEIFETGSTEKGDDIRLSFKEGGRIENIVASEGEKIERGAIVARVDKSDLESSLKEARASLSSSKASLDKILSGATKEERRVAQAAVDSARSSLASAKENLEKQEKVAKEELKDIHRGTVASLSTPSLLGDVYSAIRDIELGVIDLADKYKFSSLVAPETTKGRRHRDAIRRSAREIEKYKDMVAQDEMNFEKMEEALKETEKELKSIITEIDGFIDVIESDFYEDRFTPEDKDILRKYRREVNNLLSSIGSRIGSISSANAKIDSQLATARSSVNSAESSLNSAKRELERVEADPSSADIRVQEAQIEQVETRIANIERKISETVLRSPVTGTISDVLMRKGEVASPTSPVVVLTPEEKIQIGVDIYEGDISKVSNGDPVSASFVAFENEEFPGEIHFINPTGKMIDGVVYYNVKIILYEYPENVLPQMTVDVTITTDKREDVLKIPERAITSEQGERFVKVLENGEHVRREVETGIRGEGRMIEIISGLKEGEKVLVD